MKLTDKLANDLLDAQKQRQVGRLSILRILKSEVHQREIQIGSKAQDKDVEQVALKLAKQAKESIEQYEKSGRNKEKQAEQQELKILQEYTPKILNEADTKLAVEQAIGKLGATSLKDIGKVMGEVIKTSRGTVDGALASRIAKQILGNN